MQPLVTPVRSHLTADQVVDIIQNSSGVRISSGCELLTGMDLMVAEDFTDDFQGGSINRQSYANLHATATLSIVRELPWPNAIVRPYMVMNDGTNTAKFYLGSYFTNTPARPAWEFPVTYSVQCYDLLTVLADPVGDAFSVGEGQSYLAAVEAILQGRGIVKYYIDQSASGSVLPTDRTWPIDEQTTWLTIVNDLLGAIGYAGVYTDWEGVFRCVQYISPRQRGSEWEYNTDASTSMLGQRESERDFYGAPNRWVFVLSNNTDGPAPTEGAGKYTFVNQFEGDTSVDSRGREITKVVLVDAADHNAMVAAAQVTIDADMQIPIKIRANTAPNPLHWHFDMMYLVDPSLGVPVQAMGTQWTLPLDGSDMSHEWTVIDI